MPLNKKCSFLPLLLMLFVLSACQKEQATGNKGTDKITTVNVVTAVTDTNARDNYYIGSVEAELTVPLSFSMPGTVEKVYVSEGQYVSKGTKLAELNDETIQHNLEMTISKEKQALDAYERLSKVYKDGSLPEIKLIEVQTGLDQVRSAIQIAKKNLHDCILYAPMNGTIGRKSIDPGSNVMPIAPVFMLYKIDNVNIKVPIPENEIAKIRKGQKARIIITALGSREFTGRIDEIGVVANPVSHTYDVKVAVKNVNSIIKPGMACSVYLSGIEGENPIVVPNNAVVNELDKQYVYALAQDQKTVTKRQIIIGGFVGNNIIVKSGLNVGEKVVTAGQQKLYNNAAIAIEN